MVKWLVLVFCLLGLYVQVDGENNKYDNYTLLKITPYNEKQLKSLTRLLEDIEGGVQFLKRSNGLNISADILVSPNKKQILEDFANENGMPVEYKDYYGRFFESVERGSLRQGDSYNFDKYNSYLAIQNYITELASRAPDLVTVKSAGKSYQGRNMRVVKISTDPAAKNPIIFIDAGIHAREWVAPAMAMYLIHRLTHDREARRRELDGVDWYILPVVNPDGYEFSRTSKANRLWRKTRSETSVENCIGVDGNRNFGFQWGSTGVSHNPCHMQIYCGRMPFSEKETRIVRSIMMQNAKRLKLYVSLHSYGHYLVYPWGYTSNNLPQNWRRLHNLALMVSDSVQRAGGRPFNVMSAGQWYPAAGASDDFAFGVIGVPYSYTMELTDGFEFTFPRQLLGTIFPQYYDGFKMFSVQIKQEFGKT